MEKEPGAADAQSAVLVLNDLMEQQPHTSLEYCVG